MRRASHHDNRPTSRVPISRATASAPSGCVCMRSTERSDADRAAAARYDGPEPALHRQGPLARGRTPRSPGAARRLARESGCRSRGEARCRRAGACRVAARAGSRGSALLRIRDAFRVAASLHVCCRQHHQAGQVVGGTPRHRQDDERECRRGRDDFKCDEQQREPTRILLRERRAVPFTPASGRCTQGIEQIALATHGADIGRVRPRRLRSCGAAGSPVRQCCDRRRCARSP